MSATRRGSERQELDAYYTPDLLAQHLVQLLPIGPDDAVLEPHGGGGAFVRAARRVTPQVATCEIDPTRAEGLRASGAARVIIGDFLELPERGWTWVIGNPPYLDAAAHVRKALEVGDNVVMLLRLAFLESLERLPLWQEHPARKVWVLVTRPRFDGQGTDKTAYAWFWWQRGHAGPTELEVLDWADSRGRKDRERFTPLSPWRLRPEQAEELVELLHLPPGARVAAPDGTQDALFEALAPFRPGTLGDGLPLREWDAIVGAPPVDQLEALVPQALARLRSPGRLVLLLPLHALEAKGRLRLWREHPPTHVDALAVRPELVDAGSGAHAMGLFTWERPPAARTTLSVIEGTAVRLPVGLIERLEQIPGARQIHRCDPRLGPLLRSLLLDLRSVGARLDAMRSLGLPRRKTVRRLQEVVERIESIQGQSLEAESLDILRAICGEHAAWVAGELGWGPRGAPPPDDAPQILQETRRALKATPVYAPALTACLARGEELPGRFLPRLIARPYRRRSGTTG